MAVPVIVDTDIGTNIDDTWALALALRSPEIDVKLVTVGTGDTRYRARLAADLLKAGGRDQVPVTRGIGGHGRSGQPLARALEDTGTTAPPAKPEGDGVGAIVDTVMRSDERVTIVAIGPLSNVAAALARQPEIAARARVVSMHGALDVGYPGQPGPAAEYNAAADVEATRAVHAATWDVTVAPLDVTSSVVLAGPEPAVLRRAAESGDRLLAALLAHHRVFLDATVGPGATGGRTALHDVVAVHLACGDESLLVVEDVRVNVDDGGTLRRNRDGRSVRMATRWTDLDGFLERLTARLADPGSTGTSP